MRADSERAGNVVVAFKELLSAELCDAIGEKAFSELAVIVQEALQRERADVAGQFEALAKALRAATEPVDIGM